MDGLNFSIDAILGSTGWVESGIMNAVSTGLVPYSCIIVAYEYASWSWDLWISLISLPTPHAPSKLSYNVILNLNVSFLQ